MNSYKFLFVIGLFNLIVPFFGIPSTYKYVIFVALGVVTVGYALFIRAIVKEQEAGLVSSQKKETETVSNISPIESKKIEEVIEMSEAVEEKKVIKTPRKSRISFDDAKPRKTRKTKVQVIEEVYE